MEKWLDIFREIGEEASKVTMDIYGKDEAKKKIKRGAAGDITRGIDQVVEDIILKKLKEIGNVKLISEEIGTIELGEPEGIVIADPLDGSGNAKDGIPLFSTSLAFTENESKMGKIEIGYVRNLITGDEYHAIKGKGSYLNKRKITTSKDKVLSAVGFELYPHTTFNLQKAMRVMDKVKRVRCFGSVALDICFVAQGALSGYCDFRDVCRLLDVSAAALILKEAGGVITDDKGKSIDDKVIGLRSHSNLIAAQNSDLHTRLLEILD
ncbi:MAG: D-fructose 1,6-bisphosphatase [Thermoplasmata archaeon]|nr:MAG: D-fructose 1,6-bisphosphatase [Thermoplasmata archaeon]